MGKYDNEFGPRNAYGRTLGLLVQHINEDALVGVEAIHLDLGCGYGHLAEELERVTGLVYVGVDMDPEAVASLKDRGLEGHQGRLGAHAATLAELRKIVGGRRVASISLLDVIEHLSDAGSPVSAVAKLAGEHGALVVVSVPNITHLDVGLKLAFGRWDVTESGLLDMTHVRFYTRNSLEQALRSFGLYKFDESNVELARSDQHFPSTHPALGDKTSLHRYLTALRRDASGDDMVNQFVWACVPGPRASADGITIDREPERPFLSIVVRTQGSRSHGLREVFTCLAAQTSTDFEVVVVAHKINIEQQIAVERLIEDTPQFLRERIRLVVLDHGSRSAPLNAGFSAATGRYIAILDDDDLVFAHWIETFASMERRAAGRMLRTVSVPQRAEIVQIEGRSAGRATGPLIDQYPPTFDFLDHLKDNHTPNTAVAFPRGVFHDLGQQFDEGLSTTEDWDFMMRAASIVGVDSSPTVTCIYRWWEAAETSHTEHDEHEWLRNNGAIFRKFDESQILFPAGSARRVREILQERDQLRAEVASLAGRDSAAAECIIPNDSTIDVCRDRLDRLRRIQAILRSRSWRVAAPLRAFSRLFGHGRKVRLEDYFDLNTEQMEQVIQALFGSRSWQLTRLFRRRA
ncbi:methyltransferase domain-containing protein [Pengzhenrongella phosphoraccumulans]|uniref:methyltransferase domain-containing protein n=1 Tax=Pengzhenrongella phosphoraccumulans TaxID=3114394 RepID=UPI00388E8A66